MQLDSLADVVTGGVAPAIVAETTCVLWDHHSQGSWAMDDAVRTTLERYAGEPVGLR